MRNSDSNVDSYISYQEKVANRHLIPMLYKLNASLNKPILDVGCGKGGFTISIASALEVSIIGIDRLEKDIIEAKKVARRRNINVNFQIVDIVNDDIPGKSYGLILMRDVVEHLIDLNKVLKKLKKKLDKNGYLYVSFPPWRGPYAAHQHNAFSIVRFMPYLHVISPKIFLSMITKLEAGRKEWLADEEQIVKNRLSMKRFEKAANNEGFKTKYLNTYFLRPAFMRMGLPKIKNGWIGKIPYLGEYLTTGCEYILVHKENK